MRPPKWRPPITIRTVSYSTSARPPISNAAETLRDGERRREAALEGGKELDGVRRWQSGDAFKRLSDASKGPLHARDPSYAITRRPDTSERPWNSRQEKQRQSNKKATPPRRNRVVGEAKPWQRPLWPPRGVTDFENWPRDDSEALSLPERTESDDVFLRKTLDLRDAFREGRSLAVWTKYAALRPEVEVLRKLSESKSSRQEIATKMYTLYLGLMGKWGSALGKELDAAEEGFRMEDLDDFEGDLKEEDFEGFYLETCVEPARERLAEMKAATKNRWEAMPGLIDYVFKTKGATQEHASWIMTHRPRITELLTHLWTKRNEDRSRLKRTSLKLGRLHEVKPVTPYSKPMANKKISKSVFKPLVDQDGDVFVSVPGAADGAPALVYAQEPAFDLAAEMKTMLKLRLRVKRRLTGLQVRALAELRARVRKVGQKMDRHTKKKADPGPDYDVYKEFHDALSYRYDELALVAKGKVPPMTPSRHLSAEERGLLVDERNGRLDHEGFKATSLEEMLGREVYEKFIVALPGTPEFLDAIGSRFDWTPTREGEADREPDFQHILRQARRAVGHGNRA